MKKYLKYLLFSLMLFSCKKGLQTDNQFLTNLNNTNVGRVNTTGWFYTGAYFPSAAAHNVQGFSAIADFVKLSLRKATMRTYWLGMYYTSVLPDGTLCRRWLQFGYINDVYGNRLFLDAFEQGACGGGQYNVPVTYAPGFVYPSTGTKLEFKIQYLNGTIWRISIGGQSWVDVDLQTTLIADNNNYLQIMTESQDSNLFPDQINTHNCSVFKNGVWSLIDTGIVQTATWPIEGFLQNSKLATAEFNMGGTRGTIYPTPTQLW